MTVQEELQSIVHHARAHEWTPELFDRCQRLLGYADVFNVIRRNLTPEEYEQFDLAYCDYVRPQDAELNRWLIKERKARDWKSRETELLTRKRQLLKQKLRK